MRKFFLALAIALPGAAMGQQVDAKLSAQIISEGRVLSSEALTPRPTANLYASPIPKETRVHEAYIAYNSELYLCYFVGNPDAGTPPYATCHGPD